MDPVLSQDTFQTLPEGDALRLMHSNSIFSACSQNSALFIMLCPLWAGLSGDRMIGAITVDVVFSPERLD